MNTEFSEIEVWFTDQNNNALEIEDNVNISLIINTSLSAGKDFAKIAGKKVLTKSAEATDDLIGNKIADRITKSARNKAQKEDDRIMEERQEIIIPPEKRDQIVKDLKLF